MYAGLIAQPSFSDQKAKEFNRYTLAVAKGLKNATEDTIHKLKLTSLWTCTSS